MIYNLLLIVKGMKFKIIKKNKKQRRANQGNYQPQNKYEEVEIEYAPEEIYNEMKNKGQGKIIVKEITDTNQVFKDDLLDDEHYENINQNDIKELHNDNFDDDYDENYEDNYYENPNSYYYDNNESYSTSNTNQNYQNQN